LFGTPHTVAALVTSPIRPRRGRRPMPVSAVRQIAQQHDTPIIDPEDVNSDQARSVLAQFDADLLIVCDYGQILSAQTLAATRLGGINIHGSLLPKYRGAAPVNWAVYHGETKTGVSVIHMTPQLDAGPVIAAGRTPIDPDETADELETRLAEIGAELVPGVIDALESGQAKPLPQDSSQASKAPRLKKADGLIDWARPAAAIKNHIRAVQPWPKAYTFWHRGEGEPMRLILDPVDVVDSADATAAPGTVLKAGDDRLVIAAGTGAVAVKTLQPAGKRMLDTAEFLRGHRVQPGEMFQ